MKHFDLISNGLTVAGFNTVKSILKTNEELEVLNISNALLNPLFIDTITVPFKLKKLFLLHGSYHENDYYKKYSTNLIALLQQQSDSLEIIIIDEYVNEDVVKAIYAMPKLKEVRIKGFTKTDETVHKNDIMLTKNASIKELNILVGPKNFNILKAMINATPNLNSLKILLINYKIMKFISENAPNLRKLSIVYLNIAYLPRSDVFENLEYLDVQNYKPSLRKSLLRKNFSSLSHLEKFLYIIMVRQKFVHI